MILRIAQHLLVLCFKLCLQSIHLLFRALLPVQLPLPLPLLLLSLERRIPLLRRPLQHITGRLLILETRVSLQRKEKKLLIIMGLLLKIGKK
jgi:hypothetical protein